MPNGPGGQNHSGKAGISFLIVNARLDKFLKFKYNRLNIKMEVDDALSDDGLSDFFYIHGIGC